MVVVGGGVVFAPGAWPIQNGWECLWRIARYLGFVADVQLSCHEWGRSPMMMCRQTATASAIPTAGRFGIGGLVVGGCLRLQVSSHGPPLIGRAAAPNTSSGFTRPSGEQVGTPIPLHACLEGSVGLVAGRVWFKRSAQHWDRHRGLVRSVHQGRPHIASVGARANSDAAGAQHTQALPAHGAIVNARAAQAHAPSLSRWGPAGALDHKQVQRCAGCYYMSACGWPHHHRHHHRDRVGVKKIKSSPIFSSLF